MQRSVVTTLVSTGTTASSIVCTCHQARASSSFSTFASSWKSNDEERRRGSTSEVRDTRWTKASSEKTREDARSRSGSKSSGPTSSTVRKPFDRSSTWTTTTAPPRSRPRSQLGPRSTPSTTGTPSISQTPLNPTPSSPSSSPPKDPPLWLKHRQRMKVLFPTGWAPPKRLSREAMDLIRTMHSSDPTRYSTRVLSEHFKVSPEAVRRILKSRFSLAVEERERREKRRKELKVLERIREAEGVGESGQGGQGGQKTSWRGDLVGEVKEIQDLRQKNAVLEAGFEERRRVKSWEGKRRGGGRRKNEGK
ncbi:BQ2448_6734 [Microbotryum intermedium]|uniref:Required for respiratory growth protein 9, mitochondrial n=1 Tax=Microbotryum intermedium TaxID=269621 RepID=A0A238FKI8_9BASI|nr:BQ2448_6734 [Microbotryum intermedium]